MTATGCRDITGPNLTLLFVGFNPGEASGRTGHHFAGRNNRFWDLLHASGMTGRLLTYSEDRQLLQLGYGITNIVARPTPGSGDLSAAEMRAGAALLRTKLARLRPSIACYLGKGIYAALAGVPSPGIAYGPQPGSVQPGTLDFVAPSPSGRATIPYQTKLAVQARLTSLVREAEEANAGRAALSAAGRVPPKDCSTLSWRRAMQRVWAGLGDGKGDAMVFVLRRVIAQDGNLRVTTPAGTDLRLRALPGALDGEVVVQGGSASCGAIAVATGTLAAEEASAGGHIVPDGALVVPAGDSPGRLSLHQGRLAGEQAGRLAGLRVAGIAFGLSPSARFSDEPLECVAVRGAVSLVMHGGQDRATAGSAFAIAPETILIEPTVTIGELPVIRAGEWVLSL